MGSAEPPPVTMLPCQSRSRGNDGVGEIVRSGGRRRKWRFSEQQVRSLECMFEAQATLEPRRKAELARELGLHPHQVTVWFQNRRARRKSKQLEREYTTLRADYEALLASFDSLKREKQSLAEQLGNLSEMLERPMEERSDGGEYLKRESKDEESREPSWLSTEGRDQKPTVCSGEEELVCNPERSQWCCFDDAAGFSDLCYGGSPLGWWEPWPLDE